MRTWSSRPRGTARTHRTTGMTMLVDVVQVEVLDQHRLRLALDDGTEGIVDLASFVTFVGVFAPLRDLVVFAQVRVDAELGTVVWPNGADIDSSVLHERAIQAGA